MHTHLHAISSMEATKHVSQASCCFIMLCGLELQRTKASLIQTSPLGVMTFPAPVCCRSTYIRRKLAELRQKILLTLNVNRISVSIHQLLANDMILLRVLFDIGLRQHQATLNTLDDSLRRRLS
jgi:hypothetical protein